MDILKFRDGAVIVLKNEQECEALQAVPEAAVNKPPPPLRESDDGIQDLARALTEQVSRELK